MMEEDETSKGTWQGRQNENILKQILDDVRNGVIEEPSGPLKKASAYYKSCVDRRQRAAVGDARMKVSFLIYFILYR